MLKETVCLEGFGLVLAICALISGRSFWGALWIWQFIVGPWILLSGVSILVGIIWIHVKGD